nr:pirin family protein [Microbacterium sp. NIBRBAC000506063]
MGAWCFLDRFGPGPVKMRVEPHPHIGLQTVTWPLVGDVRHRDSVNSDVIVRRGQLNLMTAGNGISHSEYSVGRSRCRWTHCSCGPCCPKTPVTVPAASSSTTTCRR